MTRFAALLGSISLMAVSHASAQEAAWLQIEAQPTLNEAQFRAQAYASSMPEVNGFALSSGWYAIALGPYSEERAQELRREYLRTGRIPRDSYVSDGAGYGQQFWPVGAINTRNQAPIEPESPQIDTTLPEVAAAGRLYDRLGCEPIDPYVFTPVPGPRFLGLDLTHRLEETL